MPRSTLPLPATRPLNRRRTLEALGMWGTLGLGLAGCGGGDDSASTSTSTSDSSSTGSSTGSTSESSGSGTSTGSTTGTTTETTQSCSVVPEETAGPYPADGSNASNRSYNVLALAGIVRSDIRSSIDGTDTATGVPLTLEIQLTSTKNNCSALQGYAIYVWHCTAGGDYSVYTEQNVNDNYLRGVQATDAEGKVRFTTVVPGCYAGRVPHVHLEIYPSLSEASSAGHAVRTSQLAFPPTTMAAIYAASSIYSASVRNFNAISLATDNVFSDGYALQMTSMTGNATEGYTATATISIAT